MGFETVVLSVVKDVCRHAQAGFTNGTMFVACIDLDEAFRILDNVRHNAVCDVQMSKVGDEFAYDFI